MTAGTSETQKNSDLNFARLRRLSARQLPEGDKALILFLITNCLDLVTFTKAVALSVAADRPKPAGSKEEIESSCFLSTYIEMVRSRQD
jgi:hypothetical protein